MSDDPKLPYFSQVTAPPREWRLGEVVQGAYGDTQYLTNRRTASWFAVNIKGNGTIIDDSDSSNYTNLGPHRIEPDGNGGLRFVKIEPAPPAPPQPEPDRLVLEKIVYMLADLQDALKLNRTDGELRDTLDKWVPDICKALHGRRP
jgi:hypothetical protein